MVKNMTLHSQDNQSAGWWERFIGPGLALDTDKFFVICSNNLGGCYGSSGPSSINPVTGEEYAMTFPVVSVEDMVVAQSLLLDHLQVVHLHAAVGASLGGMQSIMAAALYPHRVDRWVRREGGECFHTVTELFRPPIYVVCVLAVI